MVLSNKARFIKEIIDKTLIINNKPRKTVEEELSSQSRKGGAYDKLNGSYDYLMSMPFYSLTMEKVKELNSQRDIK